MIEQGDLVLGKTVEQLLSAPGRISKHSLNDMKVQRELAGKVFRVESVLDGEYYFLKDLDGNDAEHGMGVYPERLTKL